MDAATSALRNEYVTYIRQQIPEDVTFSERDDDHYLLTSDYAAGYVNFYDLEMYVTELQIVNPKTEEPSFFLHFELNDLAYAKSLFGEFIDAFLALKDQRQVRVLLSCTSAITTTFMANKLNEAARLHSLDFSFSAIAFPNIYEKADDSDMILLAPQVALDRDKLAATLPHTPVLSIPPRLFATYDAPGVLEFVRSQWQSYIRSDRQVMRRHSLTSIDNEANILSIAVLPHNRSRFILHYRYYKKGRIIFEETVIKQQLDLVHDLCDILDTAVYRFAHYDIIGLSVGGIVNGGHIDAPRLTPKDIDLKAYLESRYHVPVIIKNNTNTAAYGYYARHRQYSNIAFLSLPFGYRFGGTGYVLNGRPYEGSHNIAGELKFTVLNAYKETDDRNFLLLPGETIRTLEKYIRNVIALMDPEIILIRCRILPDVELVRMSLETYIPEEYLPELLLVSDDESTEYMLLGMMLFCIEALE